MRGERACHICGTRTSKWCPTCVANFRHRPKAHTMSPHQRAQELRLLAGPLEIPFDLLHQRIEELLLRPVWTHELGNVDALIAEILSSQRATMDDIMAKVTAEKLIVVNVEEGKR